MRGVQFGDVVTAGQHIVDPNELWSAGKFSLRDFTLTMGQARAKLQTPVAFEAGLTVNNDTFTVTQGGATYVHKGQGVTYPVTTTSTFVAAEWVLLDEPDIRGLFVPSNVRTNIGSCEVRGTGTQTAITTGFDTSVDGVVTVENCLRFMAGAAGAVGPKFISRVKPTTILTCTSASSAASIRGWQYPVAATHTGSGVNETVDLATLPARASGRVSVSVGLGGGVAFTLSANIQWDGTTLTVSDRSCFGGFFAGAATFVASGGQLRLEWSSASARSGTATVEFDGLWTVAS
jgi:hypothetical protein